MLVTFFGSVACVGTTGDFGLVVGAIVLRGKSPVSLHSIIVWLIACAYIGFSLGGGFSWLNACLAATRATRLSISIPGLARLGISNIFTCGLYSGIGVANIVLMPKFIHRNP